MQRKSNLYYFKEFGIIRTTQKKYFKKWRKDDESLHNIKIISMEKYSPLGFNMDINSKEIFINKLNINCVHENKYIELKIISKIAILIILFF